MLEYSERTHQLMQAKYQYELQDVAEPNLYREIFDYESIPKIAFNNRLVPINMPADIWMTDTTFRDGQQSVSPFKPEQIEHLFKLESRLGGPKGLIRQSEFFLYTDRDREALERCQALETLRVLFRRSRGAYWACAALAGLCALAALLALAGPRGSRLWPFLASAGVGLAAAAMLLYLAWMGRLPARAAMTVLLPAVALALWLVLHGAAGLWISGSGPRRAAAVAAVLVGAAMLAPCARAAYHSTYNPDPAQGESACTRLERYALAHGDRLFITDLSLGDDRSLFPDWSAGKPANLLLAWGGWNNHSEGYCAAFARFGYAHDGFRIADFADSPLRLVTGAGAQPSDAFMACLNRQLGRPVTAVLEAEEGGFAVYAFTTETADKGDGNP